MNTLNCFWKNQWVWVYETLAQDAISAYCFGIIKEGPDDWRYLVVFEEHETASLIPSNVYMTGQHLAEARPKPSLELIHGGTYARKILPDSKTSSESQT